jgi:hypothetical protein
MNPAVRRAAVSGVWLMIVITVATIVITGATIVAHFVVASCACSYCGVWECVRLSFGIR